MRNIECPKYISNHHDHQTQTYLRQIGTQGEGQGVGFQMSGFFIFRFHSLGSFLLESTDLILLLWARNVSRQLLLTTSHKHTDRSPEAVSCCRNGEGGERRGAYN